LGFGEAFRAGFDVEVLDLGSFRFMRILSALLVSLKVESRVVAWRASAKDLTLFSRGTLAGTDLSLFLLVRIGSEILVTLTCFCVELKVDMDLYIH
jgi:hypothetical protein